MKDTVNQLFNDMAGYISIYWTGWWPELHFVINHEIATDITIFSDLPIDVLSVIHLRSFNLEFLDIKNKTDDAISILIVDIQSVTNNTISGSTADYYLAGAEISWVSAEVIAMWAPPTTASEIAFWDALAIFTALAIAGLVFLAQDVANCNAGPYLSAMIFFAMALVSMKEIGANKAAVDKMITESPKTVRDFNLFKDKRFRTSWAKKGFEGRTHIGLMVAQLLVLLTIITIAWGFMAEWAFDVFRSTSPS